MKIVVTGSNGFVGQYLCDYLELHGHEVMRVVRGIEKKEAGNFVPVQDFSNPSEFWGALEGASAVIYLAGLAHVPEGFINLEKARMINVSYPVKFALEASKRGISRFVYISSVKVFGENSGDGYFSASTAPCPTSKYGKLKLEAEIALQHTLREKSYIIIRPPLIYGPGVKANFLNLMRAINLRLPLPFKSLKSKRSLLFLGNLADAINCYLKNPFLKGGTYTLCDGPALSLPSICDYLAQGLHKPLKLFSLPRHLIPLLPGGGSVTRSLVVDDSEFRQNFNWHPPFAVHQSFSDTTDWFKEI